MTWYLNYSKATISLILRPVSLVGIPRAPLHHCPLPSPHSPGGQSRWSGVGQGGWSLPLVLNLRFWLSWAHSEPLSSFLNVEAFFFSPPPEETFIKLITTGMWIFLSRVGQNKECDRSSLLVKEASLQLLFKRQPTPSWHWVTLQTGIPQARTSPMLRAWDQGIHQMQSLALQPNCSIML